MKQFKYEALIAEKGIVVRHLPTSIQVAISKFGSLEVEADHLDDDSPKLKEIKKEIQYMDALIVQKINDYIQANDLSEAFSDEETAMGILKELLQQGRQTVKRVDLTRMGFPEAYLSKNQIKGYRLERLIGMSTKYKIHKL